jgi:hypothetical protein
MKPLSCHQKEQTMIAPGPIVTGAAYLHDGTVNYSIADHDYVIIGHVKVPPPGQPGRERKRAFPGPPVTAPETAAWDTAITIYEQERRTS